jgi:EpsI family protein
LDRIAVVLGLLVAVAGIYWPSAERLNWYWTDTKDHTYTHGYLVLLTSLWLILRARKRLSAVPVEPSPRAWIAVAALSTAWLWLWRAAVQDGHLLLLPVLLFTAIAATLGWRAARVLLFPIAFLYFAMPVWSDINGLLQFMSYKVVGVLLWLTGVPGYMQGNLIELPSGTLKIAEGCSGLHYFLVGLTLAALYGELSEDPPRRRAAWYALLGVMALIANWLRIYVVAVVAYTSDMHSSLVKNHYWFGWVLFVFCFAAFLWLAGRLADRWDRGRPPGPSPVAASPPPDETHVRFAPAVLTLLCLGALPALSYGMDLARPASAARVVIAWPAAPAGWHGPLPVVWSQWRPVYRRSSAKGQRGYVDSAGRTVQVFTVAYRSQRQGAKLLGWWNSLLGSKGRLRALSEGGVTAPSGSWRQTVTVDSAGTRSIIWSRFRIGDRTFVDGRLSQLWYGIAALTTRPVSSLTAFRAVCTPDCAAARARLAAATTGFEPELRLEPANRGDSAP